MGRITDHIAHKARSFALRSVVFIGGGVISIGLAFASLVLFIIFIAVLVHHYYGTVAAFGAATALCMILALGIARWTTYIVMKGDAPKPQKAAAGTEQHHTIIGIPAASSQIAERDDTPSFADLLIRHWLAAVIVAVSTILIIGPIRSARIAVKSASLWITVKQFLDAHRPPAGR